MLTSKEKVKYYLDIEQSDTSDDFFIKDLIAQTTEIIELYINRQLQYDTYTETVRGIENLYVKNTPIKDVIEVLDENGEPVAFRNTKEKIIIRKPTYTTITNATRYVEPAYTEFTVSYIGGYKEIPAAIQKVATEMVILAYKEARDNSLNVKSRSEGSVNVSYIDKLAIQPAHAEILNNYRVINI